MSNNKLATLVFAVGFLLTGYALGTYFAAPAPEPAAPAPPAPPSVAETPDGLVPIELPVYEGAPPQARFERPDEPRGPIAAASDPESADSIRAILADPDPIQRAVRLGTRLDSLGPGHTEEVYDVLTDHAIDHDGVSITLLLAYWARYDPSDASWFAMRSAPAGFRTSAAKTAVYAFARQDPEKAAQQIAANSLAPASSRAVNEKALIRGWFDSGKPGLEEYIAAQGQAEQMQRALGELVRRALLRDGPEKLARWLEGFPNDDRGFKLAAFRKAAREMTVVDPAVGVAFCEAHCDGPYGEGMRTLIARRWAAQDGPAAMAWVASQEPGIERDRAVVGAFEGWFSSSDRSGLYAWLDAMGPENTEPWLAPALDLIATTRAGRDPEGAMAWASRIPDQAKRNTTMVEVARTWRFVDREAADAWIAASSLDEATKQRAMQHPRRGLTRQQAAHENPVPQAGGATQ